MHAIVHGADVGPRRRRAPDGGISASIPSSKAIRRWWISRGAVPGCAGGHLKRVNIEIVKRSDQAQRFVVLPKRWIVERTFAWLGRCRGLAKDWECLDRKALALLKLASIRLMTRKLCKSR